MKVVRYENGPFSLEVAPAGDAEDADVCFRISDDYQKTTVEIWLPADEVENLAQDIKEAAWAARSIHNQELLKEQARQRAEKRAAAEKVKEGKQ